MNKNDNLTVDELFDEFNKLDTEAKVALSKNLNVYKAIELMNTPSDYDKALDAIDFYINSWENTKSALKELHRNVEVKRCQKLKEHAESFVAPEDAFILPDVRANNFARMVRVLLNVTRKPTIDCSKIIYEVLTRLESLKNCHINQDTTNDDIVKSVHVLKEFDIDLTKIPFWFFTDLNSRWGNFDSTEHLCIAKAIGGSNAYYVQALIGNWGETINSISLESVVESVYSLKETTEAMNKYFAELKDKF